MLKFRNNRCKVILEYYESTELLTEFAKKTCCHKTVIIDAYLFVCRTSQGMM